MFKIFFNHRVLGVCNDWSCCHKRPNAIMYKVTKNSEIQNLVTQFQHNSAMPELWLLAENPQIVFDEVQALFTVIEAAGGLVRNVRGELLLIYRYDHWDLPKGKHEPGETMPETALREVEEECGIAQLTLFDKVAQTYHIYKSDEGLVLKQTHWFTMHYAGNDMPVPQEAEGIKQVQWVPVHLLPEYMPKMFASIADVLAHVFP
jgi:8-oxo-dGTP pyrophosphatase MutT (NUDIX family)